MRNPSKLRGAGLGNDRRVGGILLKLYVSVKVVSLVWIGLGFETFGVQTFPDPAALAMSALSMAQTRSSLRLRSPGTSLHTHKAIP